MSAPQRPDLDAPYLEPRDDVDGHLHDLANAIAAARSYSEVLRTRSDPTGPGARREVVGFVLKELDRASDLVKRIREDARRPGDVLECRDCGYEFVNRKGTARRAECHRCGSERLGSWAPSE